jgi:uncharacterized protein YjaZ
MPVTIIGPDGRYLTRREVDAMNREAIQFQLYGQTWEIILTNRLPRTDGKSNDGLCDRHARRIWIRDTLEPRRMAEVVAHEINHAVYWSADEKVVDVSGKLIADVLTQLELINDD